MTSLRDLREARSAQVAEMRQILATAETEKRSLNPQEQQRFDALRTQIEQGEAAEARLSFLEEQERRQAGRPASDAAGRDLGRLEGRVSLLEVLRSQMEGRALSGAAAEFSAEAERRSGRKPQGAYVPLSLLETRAASTTSTVGEVVPTDHRAQDYILPLRNALLARRLGVRVLSGLVGNPSIPKTDTSLTVGWVAEDSALSASNLTAASVTLAPKHVGGLTELSRQLIQQSSPDIEALVREDFAFAIAKALDSAILIGGAANGPVGIVSTVGIQTQSLATLSWANCLALLGKLDVANSPAVNIVASTAVKAKLMSTLKESTDAGAGYLSDGVSLGGVPIAFTNQMALNATPNPDTGRLLAGDFGQTLLGVWSEVDLLVNPYESTAYSKGNVLVRIMSTADVAVRHAAAFCLADDITV